MFVAGMLMLLNMIPDIGYSNGIRFKTAVGTTYDYYGFPYWFYMKTNSEMQWFAVGLVPDCLFAPACCAASVYYTERRIRRREARKT